MASSDVEFIVILEADGVRGGPSAKTGNGERIEGQNSLLKSAVKRSRAYLQEEREVGRVDGLRILRLDRMILSRHGGEGDATAVSERMLFGEANGDDLFSLFVSGLLPSLPIQLSSQLFALS